MFYVWQPRRRRSREQPERRATRRRSAVSSRRRAGARSSQEKERPLRASARRTQQRCAGQRAPGLPPGSHGPPGRASFREKLFLGAFFLLLSCSTQGLFSAPRCRGGGCPLALPCCHSPDGPVRGSAPAGPPLLAKSKRQFGFCRANTLGSLPPPVFPSRARAGSRVVGKNERRRSGAARWPAHRPAGAPQRPRGRPPGRPPCPRRQGAEAPLPAGSPRSRVGPIRLVSAAAEPGRLVGSPGQSWILRQ